MSPNASPHTRRTRRPPCWRCRVRAGIVAALTAIGISVAWAGEDKDHDRVRAAVRAGEVMPFDALRERLRRSHPGELLDLELEREHGRWIYEVKLLQPDGRIVKLELDARSGEILRERPGQRRR